MDIVESGTDIKIAVSVSIDGFSMSEMEFTCEIVGDRGGKVTLAKSDMKKVNTNCYLAVLTGSTNALLGQITVYAYMQVPDADYDDTQYRTEKVKINPNIWVA